MNIGFDLDKIFINYPPFVPTKLIDRLYKHKSNGVLLYRIPSKPEQIIRILSHHPFLRPPIVKNLEFIKKLSSNKKNKHFLISSRFSFLKNRTNAIINKYLFDRIFDSKIFRNGYNKLCCFRSWSNKNPSFYRDYNFYNNLFFLNF